MASANPDAGGAEMLYPVAIEARVVGEFGGSVGAGDQLPAEAGAAIVASVPAQLEWLDAIEAALGELQRRQIEAPGLAEAAAVAVRLRSVLASAEASGKSAKALWLCLYGCISLPFLQHFSSAVGDDLGHAAAHKIITVLTSITHWLNP